MRVFSLNMTADEVRLLRNENGPSSDMTLRNADPVEVAALLGLDTIDPAFVEIVDVADLSDVGLGGYLIEGSAAVEKQIAADRAWLDEQNGHVMIVYSRAFGGHAATLQPDKRLKLIGVYAEDVPPVRFEPLPSDSAQGTLSGPRPKTPMSDARVSGMVAVVVLAVLFILVAVFVRMAG
ncbi:MAG: hypothetical protein DI533_13960 [Cereibacter sphaeroides]|uniref:Uncharacterized protein n=1 Tax=Cereibacter sphaeroides TaxID=1063 RepID=A0A2W5S6R5_CERSP|nr:MAG: hypothetical protein DI533_13960 [Cereibacter sphaeroides]